MPRFPCPAIAACGSRMNVKTVKDALLGVGTVVLGSTYLFAANLLPALHTGDPVGPKTFPYLIGIATLVCGVVIGTRAILGHSHGDWSDDENDAPTRMLAVGGVYIWTLLYFLVFEPLGFLLSCTMFMLGLCFFFNRGHPIANLIVSFAIPFFTYALFTLLGITLPSGVIPY
jgi:putative tricarboxylic transport membrane protein